MPRGQPTDSASSYELHTVKKGKDGGDYIVELIHNKKVWIPYYELSSSSSDEDIKQTDISKKEKRQRAPSKYNIFIGEKIKFIKENMPNIPNTERMKKAQEMWHAHKVLEQLASG